MKPPLQSETNYTGGYVALLLVILAGAVGTTIALSLLLFGIQSTQNSLSVMQSAQARGLANACAEVAVKNIAQSSVYVGTGTVPVGQGSCTFTVVSVSPLLSTITSIGTVGTTVRKVSLTALLGITKPNGFLGTSDWQEIP